MKEVVLVKNILIATCGTSILTNNRAIFQDILGEKKLNEISLEESKLIKEKVLAFLMEKDMNDKKCGAELNSTYYILEKGYFSNDTIHLIVSDSEEGILSGEIIKTLLLEKLKTNNVIISKIENLNISKEYEFAKKGLRNLVSKVTHIISGNEHNTIIAPIGGLKAQIFVVGLLGQLFKIPAYYLYENSTTIIELLPLPISLDISFFMRNLDLISKINKAGMIEKKYINTYLHQEPELRNILDDEKMDGESWIALSTLGTIAFEKLIQDSLSFLPRDAKEGEKQWDIQFKRNEKHLERMLNYSDCLKVIDLILNLPYVKKVYIDYFNPDNKGDIIRITNSSNNLEGAALRFEINRKQGITGGMIFLTENSEENLNAAKIDIIEKINNL